ncbi:hypothetical protein H920_13414 [Fukomys damarensis]|uniref:Uncharacterized protein n=1 Tax=Fukomys damarensis TaxID=885580 RepID=A0A091D418_FUKDA|nr:hypothetical protein H920_13414 [Fukomys damarensis]
MSQGNGDPLEVVELKRQHYNYKAHVGVTGETCVQTVLGNSSVTSAKGDDDTWLFSGDGAEVQRYPLYRRRRTHDSPSEVQERKGDGHMCVGRKKQGNYGERSSTSDSRGRTRLGLERPKPYEPGTISDQSEKGCNMHCPKCEAQQCQGGTDHNGTTPHAQTETPRPPLPPVDTQAAQQGEDFVAECRDKDSLDKEYYVI